MREAAPITILNVDRDDADGSAITRFLERAGFRVVEARTGKEALRLANERPDLVVLDLDLDLPDMSGREVSRRLKSVAKTGQIPIMHLAPPGSNGSSPAREQRSGSDGYVARPVEPAAMLAAIRVLLRAHHTETDLPTVDRDSEAAFDAVQHPICVLDADGRIVRANTSMARLVDRPMTEILARHYPEIFGPVVGGAPAFEDVRRGDCRQVGEGAYRNRWFQIALDPVHGPDGRVNGAVCTMTDVTEKRRIELDLWEVDEARQAIFDASPLAIIGFDPKGYVEAWSPAAERLLGWPAEEVIGKRYPAVPAEKAAEFEDELTRTMAGEGFSALETWRLRRDGRRVEVSVWAAPTRDAAGDLRGAIHVLADITERRRVDAERERLVRDLAASGAENARLLREAEEGRRRAERDRAALAESEALYRAIGESTPYGVWVCHPDGKLRFLSRNFLDLVGMSLEDYRAQGWLSRLPAEDVDRAQEDWLRCVKEGANWDSELRVLAADGEYRTILSRGGPVRNPDGLIVGYAGINLDITARKRSSQALAFLSDASTMLASSLDQESILANLASTAVPTLGDWCAVDVVLTPGSLTRLGVAHVDPERTELLKEVDRRYPVEDYSDGRPLKALRTGRPELIEEVDEATLASIARDEEHAELLRQIGARALMWVPLVARGRTLGVMSLGVAQDGRRFRPEDLTLAEETARRAALAIDNARLFEAERAARGQAQDTQARLTLLARAERARAAELNAVIRAIGDALIVADAAGQILLVNPAADDLVEGQSISTLAELFSRFRRSERDPVDVTETLAAAETGESVELHRPGEPDRWFELKAYRVEEPVGVDGGDVAGGDSWPAGEIAASILVFRDVTAARQAHILREAFVGMLSHELRTPITTIYAGTKVLARPAERIGEETRREVYRDLEAEADRLYRLIEDLLVLSRVEGGAIEIGSEPTLLQHVLSEVVRTEQQRWPSARFKLSVPLGLPAVMADRTYVEQVVRNLLSNAAKYSPDGAEIDVTAERVEDEVRVMVRDEGAGIDPAEANQLFELFYRSPATAGKAGGAGIGLFVTRHLVEAMGGRIWAQPRPAGGAEFGFSLRAMGDDEG